MNHQGVFPVVHRYAAQQRELAYGSARTVAVTMAITVDRVGQAEADVDFKTFFFEPPNFTYGVVAVSPITLGVLPLATAIVRTWQQTTRGFYRGANLGFALWRPPDTPAGTPEVQVEFHLHFEGIAAPTLHGLEG